MAKSEEIRDNINVSEQKYLPLKNLDQGGDVDSEVIKAREELNEAYRAWMKPVVI